LVGEDFEPAGLEDGGTVGAGKLKRAGGIVALLGAAVPCGHLMHASIAAEALRLGSAL